MSAATRNLQIEAGTTFRRTLRFFEDKERTMPIDLTGWTFAAWIWRGTFKIEFAIEITDAEGGTAVMELEPDQTRDVMPGEYTWDMLVRTASGDVKKYFKGTATIHPTGTQLTAEA